MQYQNKSQPQRNPAPPGHHNSQHPPYPPQSAHYEAYDRAVPPPHNGQYPARPNQPTPYSGQHRPPQRRRRPTPEERRRQLIRAWVRVIAVVLAFLVVAGLAVYGAVRLVGSFFKPPKTASIPPANPIAAKEPTETEPEPTQTEEPVVSLQASEVLAQAEFLAAGYDYDAAMETLQSFGGDWQSQPGFQEASQRFQTEQSNLVRWPDTTQITHIFFHSLIVDTSRAFDSDYTNDGYNQYMATVDEFRAILEELYARGFVLVRMHDVAKLSSNESGQQVYTQGDIYLPAGKKPIVISQDDVNYYEYMIDGDEDHFPDATGDGFASKIVIGEDGYPTCEYITAQGETVYGEYDLVPILEAFVQEHPDFSYRGARAVLGVTGYQGVFGYRTHPDWRSILGESAFQAEFEAAQKVTQCLKDKGWEIASHSFGHPAYGEISDERVSTDVEKWEAQVQPVVGDTDIFIYPYGSDIAGIEEYSGAKFDAMYKAGYRYFCNVDSAQYWTQIHDSYVRQARRNIDGYRMWWNPELLDDLFDVSKIMDKNRPTPVPSIV